MNNLLAVFVAAFLATIIITILGGGERNWGYVTIGALILAAVATGVYALVTRLSRRQDRQ